MLWVIHCLDGSDTAAAREEHLVVHRAYLDTMRTKIFFSGPLQNDDASASLGSLFILNVKDRDEAQAFADNEPFHRNGIFRSVTITRMRKGRYNPEIVDVA